MNARAFTRDVDLPGWSGQSVWGYDELLECYWANLWRDDDQFDAPRIAISSYHLIPTPNALARVIAGHLGIDDDDAYLALVGHSSLNRIRSSLGTARAGPLMDVTDLTGEQIQAGLRA